MILIPTDAGVLVCADRRRSFAPSSVEKALQVRDDLTKIHVVSDRCVFALVGVSVITVEIDKGPEFDFSSAILKGFLAAGPRVDLDLDLVARSVEESYDGWLAAHGKEARLSPADHQPFTFYTVYLDRQDHPLMARTRAYLRPDSTRILLKTDYQKRLAVLTDGSLEVVEEIARGSDPRFDDLRADPAARLLRGFTLAPPLPPVAESEAAARRLIRWTSERHTELTHLPSIVGLNADCGVMRADGFRWSGAAPKP